MQDPKASSNSFESAIYNSGQYRDCDKLFGGDGTYNYATSQIDIEDFKSPVGTLRQQTSSSDDDSEDESNDLSNDTMANDRDINDTRKHDILPNVRMTNNESCTGYLESYRLYLKIFIIFITVFLPPIIGYIYGSYDLSKIYHLGKEIKKLVYTPSLDELLAEQFHIYNFISARKQLELKRNLNAKVYSKSETDPLSIFILHHQNQFENATRFAENVGHIFAKHVSTDTIIPILAYPGSDLFNQKSDIESLWDTKLQTSYSVVVQNFTELAWDYAKIFLKYCDNDNAPFKSRLFIFLASSKHCNISRPDKSVEENLVRVWGVDDETIEALIVRISSISMCFK